MAEIQLIQFRNPVLIESDSPDMLGLLGLMAARLEPVTHRLTLGSRVCLEDLGITVMYASSVGEGPTALVTNARADSIVWVNKSNPINLIGQQETGGFKVFGVVMKTETGRLDDLRTLDV